jgi:hypothetical protein
MATRFSRAAITDSTPQILSLVKENLPALEKRLAPGLVEGMTESLKVLTRTESETITLTTNKKAATELQRQVVKRCSKKTSKFKKAVRRHVKAPEIRKDFGIGEKSRSNSVVSVTAAAETVIKAGRAYPEAARQAGILPEDLTQLEAEVLLVRGADATQGAKKATVKNVVAERNAAHQFLEEGLLKLEAIAEIVFEDQPEILARVRSAMPTPRRSARSGSKNARETPAEYVATPKTPVSDKPDPK